MTLYYEMEYYSGDEREVCRLHAENDEEAVAKAKEQFLRFVEFNRLSTNSRLIRVYRAPENLIKKIYRFSVTEGKDIFSLIESKY